MLAHSKKILTIAGIALAGMVLFGAKKYSEGREVLSNLEFFPKTFSNFRVTLNKIYFDVVLSVTNTTNIDFGATATSKIAIKQVRVYTRKGTYIGKADTNIYKI